MKGMRHPAKVDRTADGGVEATVEHRLTGLPLCLHQEELLAGEEIWARRSARRLPLNLVDAVSVEGALDLGALSRALSAVIDRHSAFRTSVRPTYGMPKAVREYQLLAFQRTGVCGPGLYEQSIGPVRRLQIRLRQRPADAVPGWQAWAGRTVYEQSAISFDYAKPPLVRLVALRVTARHHVIVVAVPRLICDWPSLDIFWSDLFRLYARLRCDSADGSERREDDLLWAGQFHTFASWQVAQTTGGFEQAASYWRSRWTSPEYEPFPLYALDFWKPGRGFGLPSTTTLSTVIESLLHDAIRQAAAALQVSVYVMCLTAFAVLLNRSSSRDQVGIWLSCPNRGNETAEETIGWIANRHLITLSMSRGATAEALIAQTAAVVSEAMEHEELPLAVLWRRLGRRYDRPSQGAMFEWIPGYAIGVVADLSVRRLTLDTRTVAVFSGLCLRIVDLPEALSVNVVYSRTQFGGNEARAALSLYCELLAGLVSSISNVGVSLTSGVGLAGSASAGAATGHREIRR